MRELSRQIIEHVRRAEEPAGVRTADGGGGATTALAEHAIRIARTAASIHLARAARNQSRAAPHHDAAAFEPQTLELAGESTSLAREHQS